MLPSTAVDMEGRDEDLKSVVSLMLCGPTWKSPAQLHVKYLGLQTSFRRCRCPHRLLALCSD